MSGCSVAGLLRLEEILVREAGEERVEVGGRQLQVDVPGEGKIAEDEEVDLWG